MLALMVADLKLLSHCSRSLHTFRKEHGIDEFFLLTLIPDAAIRKNSYTLMSRAAGLNRSAEAAE